MKRTHLLCGREREKNVDDDDYFTIILMPNHLVREIIGIGNVPLVLQCA